MAGGGGRIFCFELQSRRRRRRKKAVRRRCGKAGGPRPDMPFERPCGGGGQDYGTDGRVGCDRAATDHHCAGDPLLSGERGRAERDRGQRQGPGLLPSILADRAGARRCWRNRANGCVGALVERSRLFTRPFQDGQSSGAPALQADPSVRRGSPIGGRARFIHRSDAALFMSFLLWSKVPRSESTVTPASGPPILTGSR